MALQVCNLSYDHGDDRRLDYGVVILDTVTNLTIPISCHAFSDADDAEAFLRWLATLRGPRDIRQFREAELTNLSVRWNTTERAAFAKQERAERDEEDIRQ